MMVSVPIKSSRMDKVDVVVRLLFLKHRKSSLQVAVIGLHSCGLQEVTNCTLYVQPAGCGPACLPFYIHQRPLRSRSRRSRIGLMNCLHKYGAHSAARDGLTNPSSQTMHTGHPTPRINL